MPAPPSDGDCHQHPEIPLSAGEADALIFALALPPHDLSLKKEGSPLTPSIEGGSLDKSLPYSFILIWIDFMLSSHNGGKESQNE